MVHKLGSIKVKGLSVLLAFVFGFMAFASNAAAATKIKFDEKKTVIKEIKIKGDLRLRHENFDKESPKSDRQRQRIRFRLSADFKLPHKFKVKTRLASGVGEQTSTNQTLDSNQSQKDIWLDRAFLQWTPKDIFDLRGGKMANPFWKAYSSDVLWDTDVNPEGLAESASGLVGNVFLFANLGQFVVEERSSSQKDLSLWVSEGGAEFKLPAQTRIKTSLAYHDWKNITDGATTAPAQPGTNTVDANGVRVHNFYLLQWTLALNGWIASVPWVVDGTLVTNNGYNTKLQEATNPGIEDQDSAAQAGIRIGKAKKQNTWEGAYYYKEVQADAVMDELADADFGGTNRRGHIYWIAYKATDFIKLKIKVFDTRKIIRTTTDDRVVRSQFDIETKF